MQAPIYHPTPAQLALVSELKQHIANAQVLEALASVPRHSFVASAWSTKAYANVPLPIGRGQTISQPLVVARITELLLNYLYVRPRKTGKVLEIGGGCGYQAAVLQHCFDAVYSVEREAELFQRTRERLDQLGYNRVYLRHADGMLGWPQRAPFDAVVFSCGVSVGSANFEAGLRSILQPIFAQMAQLSCLVVPAGRGEDQRLCLFERHKHDWELSYDLAVRFVPCREGVNS